MKRKEYQQMILTSVVCLLPIVLALALYRELPEQIPIHFDLAGEVDNYASKPLACFGLPLFLAALNLFVHFMLQTDPKKGHAAKIMRMVSLWTIPVIALIVQLITLFTALGYSIPVGRIVPCLVGVLFVICGNYLPKCRQNYTIGIKLPWTLNHEENWNKTHRLAGYLWVIGGLAVIIAGLLGYPAVMFIAIAALAVITCIYSYILHRKGL